MGYWKFKFIFRISLCFVMILTFITCKPIPPTIMPYEIKLQELYDQLFWSLPQWTYKFYTWKGDYERKERVSKFRKSIFEYFPEWSDNYKSAILENKAIAGMNEWQVLAALGIPNYPNHDMFFYKFITDKTITEKGVQKILKFRDLDLEIIFFNNQVTQILVDGVSISTFFIPSE